jgi:hypothetical protein
MGTGFAQHTALSVGNLDSSTRVSRHTAHAMWVQGHAAVLRRLQQVLLQACAHLFVTATEF